LSLFHTGDPAHTPSTAHAGLRAKLTDYLSLERNVSIASAAVFLVGLGEELWKKFLPKYLEALGASTPIIGLFGTVEDFFDAIYQYPGGWLADRLGRRRAFLIFLGVASVGYVVYLTSVTTSFTRRCAMTSFPVL
jgi:MFS family permease